MCVVMKSPYWNYLIGYIGFYRTKPKKFKKYINVLTKKKM